MSEPEPENLEAPAPTEKELAPLEPLTIFPGGLHFHKFPPSIDDDATTEVPLTKVMEIIDAIPGDSGATQEWTAIESSTKMANAPAALSRNSIFPLPYPFGNYELLSEIARGGMGVVFKAKQNNLKRIVAVKMILAGRLASDHEVERFLVEARAAANLQHPNIVGIYEVGEIFNQHFFSMEFVDGQSLAQLVENQPLDPARAVNYLIEIANAIQYAHAHGILHRDLKPSNILIDGAGQSKVTDFGLAKALDAQNESRLTASGAVVGTPSYMSPEQAGRRGTKVDATSDVYSLGAILYELLTGRPPFQAASHIDTILQVLNIEPVGPTLLNPKIPLDLATITLKCLSKDQSRRYASAAELAEDLRRWRDGEPILARPISSKEIFVRWCKRNPRVASLWGSLIVVVLMAAIGGWVAAIQINDSKKESDQAKLDAQANLKEALSTVDELLMSGASDVEEFANIDDLKTLMLERARNAYKRLVSRKPTDPEVRFDQARMYQELATIEEKLGNIEEANVLFVTASEALDALQSEFPDNVAYRIRFARVQNLNGELYRNTQRTNVAEIHYQLAVDSLQKDAEANKEANAEYSRGLANLGIIARDRGNGKRAEDYFRAAIANFEKLAVEDPSRDVIHWLAQAQNNLGILYRQLRRNDEAETAYKNSIRHFRSLLEKYSQKVEYRRELAVNLRSLANLLLSQRQFENALKFSEESRQKFVELETQFPNRHEFHQEAANTLNTIGYLYLQLNREDKAKESFEASLARSEKLLADPKLSNSAKTIVKVNLANALVNLAELIRKTKIPIADLESVLEVALTNADRAAVLYAEIVAENPDNPQFKQLDQANYILRAEIHIQRGDHVKAAKVTRELLAKSKKLDGPQEFRAAAAFAQCVRLAQQDQSTSDAAELSQQYASDAIESLRAAVKHGYSKREQLQSDRRFEPLRGFTDFQRFISTASGGSKQP